MKVLAILADAWDPPGALLETCAARRGVAIDARTPPDGDGLPSDDTGHCGLVMLGGPQSAYNVEADEFLQAAAALIRRFHDAAKPILGICLGAQMIARAFGARCYEGAEPERGFHRIYPTADAYHDPLLPTISDDGVRLLQFHRDTFDLPKGAIHLMRGDNYENQAFRLNETTYGFQPHIEATTESFGTWLHTGPGVNYRQRIPDTWAELAAEIHLCDENHEPLTMTFADRWFALAVKRAR